MKTKIWKAAKLLLSQFLKLDINEQLVREVDYLKAENQVLKNQLTQSGKRLRFTVGHLRRKSKPLKEIY